MTAIPLIIHYLAIALSTVLAAVGVCFGQGAATSAAFTAINRQPSIQPAITRSTILALALIETSAILGLIVSFILFLGSNAAPTLPQALGEIGMGLAIGLPALVTGFATAMPAHATLEATARQPFLAAKLSNFMLLTQSLIQTPLIFGLIIALFIKGQLASITTISQGLTLIGSGIAIGFGSLGPALGGGFFTKKACESIGMNRLAYSRLFTFTFISQAIIETPVIFASIISLYLSSIASSVNPAPIIGLAYMAFGATIGFGTFGAGISSGRSAAAAAVQIAQQPNLYGTFSRASLMAQGLIDTCAVYAFIISLWLILTPLV